MSGELQLLEEEEAYLGPVAVALFVDIGWIRHWPKVWTKAGRKAMRNGFGRWSGTSQALPRPLETAGTGAACWPGRRTNLTNRNW